MCSGPPAVRPVTCAKMSTPGLLGCPGMPLRRQMTRRPCLCLPVCSLCTAALTNPRLSPGSGCSARLPAGPVPRGVPQSTGVPGLRASWRELREPSRSFTPPRRHLWGQNSKDSVGDRPLQSKHLGHHVLLPGCCAKFSY